MDWNMKAASWDLSELDQEAATPTVGTVEGSSRFGVDRSKGEFSVDLKLGQVGNSSNEPAVAKWKDVGGGVSKVASSSSSSSSPSSGSSKRARAINNGTQTVSCLVDGCNADLSHCRDYHKRHKVCELHSKTPVVTIGGNKQRFCQQCSRFHSLEEFDEGKRSCRKRLDGHNRRRRKPQPDALARSGTQVLSFSSSHVYSSNAMAHPAWNAAVTSCAEGRLPSHHHPQPQQMHHLVDKQNLFLGSSSTYKEGNKQRHLAFLQADNSTTMENNNNQSNTALAPPPQPVVSVCQTFLRTTTPLSSPLHDHDSHCALSLLSSPHAHTSGSGLNQMVQPPHHAMTLMHNHQSLGLSLHDHSLEPVDPVLVHSESDHCPAMYNMNEAPQPFPFHWE